MRRSGSRSAAFAFFFLLGALLGDRSAHADPGLGYIDLGYAIPYHAAWSSIVEDGKRVTESELGLRSQFGAQALSGGIGLGYTGLNGQLDFRNALQLTTGAATIGIREKLSLAGFELWVRCGIGPEIVFDVHNPTKLQLAGGIATDFEAGVDFFFLPFLAIGIKGTGWPEYSWPLNASVDLGLAIALRAAL